MLNNLEKSQLRSLVQDPRWGVLIKLKDEFVGHIKDDVPIRDDQWGTLQAVFMQAGKVEGINNFIQEVYKSAQ